MKAGFITTFILINIFLFSGSVSAQFTIGLNGSSYYFVNSRDNNLHFGGQFRMARDWQNYMLEFDAGYFANAISSVRSKAYEVHPETNIPQSLNINNSVTAYTIMSDLNFLYYFTGMPADGKGFYGLAGVGGFYYDQTYNLSHFNPTEYYSEQYIDGANYASTQLILNFGLGGKVPMRKSSWFYEAKFSFLTDPYKDYERAVQGSHFITVSTGFRFHVVTRKSRYERISMGRSSKQIKKSKKRLRK